jgi:hypothetical protein
MCCRGIRLTNIDLNKIRKSLSDPGAKVAIGPNGEIEPLEDKDSSKLNISNNKKTVLKESRWF